MLLIAEGCGLRASGSKEYSAYVLEAPSRELAQAICSHIGKDCSNWMDR